MAQAFAASITRRSVVAGLTLAAGPVGVLAADKTHAQTTQTLLAFRLPITDREGHCWLRT